ncbi:hypothetical protein WMY93_019688 [Mugilogobius chulae]|uniref:Uncharacterized protein n=1 Tax=Mugilogobius chulae TaxID=88201 RepID=A0AAW0NJV7_9GOBI
MDVIKESNGIYQRIKMLFETPVYKRAVQLCWVQQIYKNNIAVVLEWFNLQQQGLLSSDITEDHMKDFLLDKDMKSFKYIMWTSELEMIDEEVLRRLLTLTWDVINGLKMRDVMFEARRLLQAPARVPSSFLSPKVISMARSYSSELSQKDLDPLRWLTPRKVVTEVVTDVFTRLWQPSSSSAQFSMPSSELSAPAVSLTQAILHKVLKVLSTTEVEVTFSHSIRDQMVNNILHKVWDIFPEHELQMRLSRFSKDLLMFVTQVTAAEVCEFIELQTDATTDPGTTSDQEVSPQSGDQTVLETSQFEDQTMTVVETSQSENQTATMLETSPSEDQTVTLLETSQSEEQTVPVLEFSTGSQDQTGPVLETSESEVQTVPVLESSSGSQDQTVPVLETPQSEDQTSIVIESSSQSERTTVPVVELSKSEEQIVPVLLSQLEDNTVPVLESSSQSVDHSVPVWSSAVSRITVHPTAVRTSVDTGVQIQDGTSVDTGVQTPVITSVDTGVQTPLITSVDTGVQTPVITSVDTGVQTPLITSVDTGVQTPLKTSVDTGVQTPDITSVDTGVQTPLITSVDTGVQTQFGKSVDTGVQTPLITSVDTGVQTSSPSEKGCVFCRFRKWLRRMKKRCFN